MPRPRTVQRGADSVISNGELARVFREIGDMLDILGEVVYKAVAYRRVADAVERYPADVAALLPAAKAAGLRGAGADSARTEQKIAETGGRACGCANGRWPRRPRRHPRSRS